MSKSTPTPTPTPTSSIANSHSLNLADIIIADNSKVSRERVIGAILSAWTERDNAIVERDALLTERASLNGACVAWEAHSQAINSVCELLRTDNERLQNQLLRRNLSDIIRDTWSSGIDGKALIITIASIIILFIPEFFVSIADLVLSAISSK